MAYDISKRINTLEALLRNIYARIARLNENANRSYAQTAQLAQLVNSASKVESELDELYRQL